MHQAEAAIGQSEECEYSHTAVVRFSASSKLTVGDPLSKCAWKDTWYAVEFIGEISLLFPPLFQWYVVDIAVISADRKTCRVLIGEKDNGHTGYTWIDVPMANFLRIGCIVSERSPQAMKEPAATVTPLTDTVRMQLDKTVIASQR